MEKIIKTVIAEVVGAFFFIGMAIIVRILEKDMPYFPFKVSHIVSLWTIYGIGAPIAIYTDLFEKIAEIIK